MIDVPLLGAHQSIAGGLHRALERGLEAGRDAVQLLTRSSRQWAARPVPTLLGDPRYALLNPAELGEPEVRAFLTHLVDERRVSASTHGVYAAALRFLYAVTLRRPDISTLIPRPRVVRSLPTILSPAEVERLIATAWSAKYRALFMTAYGAGLRVGELATLEHADIDAARLMLRIRAGKNGHDRDVPLSARLLAVLRAYWHEARPPGTYLFQGNRPGHPISRKAIWHMLRKVSRRAGITKPIFPHTLRHNAESPVMRS